MKNIVFLYLLFLSPFIFSQSSWPENLYMDQLLADQERKSTSLYPLKNLVVLDREKVPENENEWLLGPSTMPTSDATEVFSSLLLAEHLKQLNQITPFNVKHNATMDRFIRVYLKNRQENLSLLLGKASYYFPVFQFVL